MPVEFSVLGETFCITKLPVGTNLDGCLAPGGFYSVTVDSDEITIVADQTFVHSDAVVDSGWRAIKLAGPFSFELAGVLSSVLAPLANAGVGIYAMSTFSTDYVFVKGRNIDEAIRALQSAGHTCRETSDHAVRRSNIDQ